MHEMHKAETSCATSATQGVLYLYVNFLDQVLIAEPTRRMQTSIRSVVNVYYVF